MKKITTLSTLAVLSLLAYATPALAQTAPASMSTNLAEMATVFGDANDHLSFLDVAGQTQVLAYEQRRSYVAYTAGDAVSGGDVFAFCAEDVTGGLSSCDIVDGTEPNEYTCGFSSCSCTKIVDCFIMTLTACTTPLSCDWGSYSPECTCGSY